MKQVELDYKLIGSASNGNLDEVKECLREGADIHADNDDALRWASRNGHLDIVKYLVEQGADIHADNDWPLRYSTQYGHHDVVRFLRTADKHYHITKEILV